ncbi:MAG: AraC family transcriptional regulator [Muribaculaceae bacterium]|nr:AraC family transcriptional regulator [Muribaculaceae bacterium]
MFGLIVHGELQCAIDFQHYNLSSDSIVVLSPRQVHKFLSESGIEAFMLLVNPDIMTDNLRKLFDEIDLLPSPVFEAGDYSDLKILLELISRQENVSVGKKMVMAFIEMIADKISNQISGQLKVSGRKKELMFGFRNLLRENITRERRPAYYSDRLNISTVYLNEIVNSLSGYSVSQYIKNEIILMAKRELYYSEDSIKAIASKLGFDDSAYFTRLFTETVGIAPTEFRKNLV